MEQRRLLTFMLTASLVMLAYLQFQLYLNPPQPDEEGVPPAVAEQQTDDLASVDAEAASDASLDEPSDRIAAGGTEDSADAGKTDDAAAGDSRDAAEVATAAVDGGEATVADTDPPVGPQNHVLGTLAPDGEFPFAITFSNRGGVIERIELNHPSYEELEQDQGYLGSLHLSDAAKGGCRINTVAPGSPAAAARCADSSVEGGLRGAGYSNESGSLVPSHEGDRIVEVDGNAMADAASWDDYLRRNTRPGQSIQLTVMRPGADGTESRLSFAADLGRRPLSIVQPERGFDGDQGSEDPLSFLLTLGRLSDAKVGLGEDEIEGLPSLWDAYWRVRQIDDGLEFSKRLTAEETAAIGGKSGLEIVKRYRLRPGSYAIDFDIELRNLGDEPQTVTYQLDGPTGLPLEGWWYSYKTHPTSFSMAGARDVVFREEAGSHQLFVCSQITKQAMEEEKSPFTPLAESGDRLQMRYAGCDTQYFSVVLLPSDAEGQPTAMPIGNAIARPVGLLDEENRKKRTNVSFRLTSRVLDLAPGASTADSFLIYAGPKDAEILEEFGLEDCIVYGWFGFVAKPMLAILHFFRGIIPSWGLSIVCLTVLVRGCMYPFGRQMALNAQKMQELAPEMKAIAEKHKNDLEKRAQAQRELFAKHKYNPLAGCPVMLLQLPIFVGLYRSLSVDIALRQAPFFPGMSWCANLAGPDKLWNWEALLPGWISSPNGYLGPYLNILPLVAAGLMLLQQKMFTPPPQDEQQEMQQKIMKFMMLFMALIFHKVASGLCVYLIASSLWAIAERRLLPKPKLSPKGGTGDAASSSTERKVRAGNSADDAPKEGAMQSAKRAWEELSRIGSQGPNGSQESPGERKKRRKKRR